MPDLHQRGHQLERDFKAMARSGAMRAPYIGLHRDHFLKPAATENWDRLAREASKLREQATKGIRRLTPMAKDMSALYDRTAEFMAEAEREWVPPRKRPDWPEVRQRILNGLPPGTPPSRAKKLVDEIGGLRSADMRKQVFAPLRSMAERFEEAGTSWQAALLGADLATTIARFNQVRRPALDDEDDIAAWLDDSASELEDRHKALQRALRRGDWAEVGSVSRDLQRWATGGVLEEALRSAAALAFARQTGARRWTLGPAALATSDLIRELLVAQALAYRAGLIGRLGFGPAEEWRKAARLPFASRWRPPSATPIASLWSQPRRFDGRLVTVEGVAGLVANPHRRGKVYSSVSVADPGGASIRVGITHIKLDSGGLVEGAYVRVTGKFVAADKDYGTPVLRVARRSLVEDAERSWLDWAALQARRLYTPVPHGLTMAFSWETGLDGPGNQLRYGTWQPYEKGA